MDGHSFAQGLIIQPHFLQPYQQGPFGWVAHKFDLAVQMLHLSRGIDGAPQAKKVESGRILEGKPLRPFIVFSTEEDFFNRHLVFGEGARLVGANYRCAADGLCCHHFAHQVIIFPDLAHSKTQCDKDRHGQSFGNRNDDDRHCHHEEF